MMKSPLSITCYEDPAALLALGRRWDALCDSKSAFPTAKANFAQLVDSSSHRASRPLGCERNLIWALSSLSLLPETQRRIRVFAANRDSQVVGILPMISFAAERDKHWEILGARGTFGDGKGIIAQAADQVEVGYAFAEFIAEDWIGAGHIKLHGLWENDEGMRAFYERFSESTSWDCEYNAQNSARLVYRIPQGPDGNPIWPLAARRRLQFVQKALESGMFQAVFSTKKEDILQNAMVLRNMLRNDADVLKNPFGPIHRTQRFLDYRFGQGDAPEMCQSGTLTSCQILYKSKPIAGALAWDIHQARHVFWLESKAVGEQAPLIFWMLLSKLIEDCYQHATQEIHLDPVWKPWTAGMPNLAPETWNADLLTKEDSGHGTEGNKSQINHQNATLAPANHEVYAP